MDIIIGFSKPKKFNFFSKLIQFFERTPYSHVYIKINSSLDIDIIYQAGIHGVNFVGTDLFNLKSEVVYEYKISIDNDKKNDLLRFLIKNSGKPYSISQIIGLSLYNLFGIKLFKNNDKKFICSELAAVILNFIGLDINLQNTDYISPKDIYNFISKNSKFKLVTIQQ